MSELRAEKRRPGGFITARLQIVPFQQRHQEGLLQLWTCSCVMSKVGFPMGLPMDMEAVSGYLAEQERLSEKAWSKRQHLAVERRDGVFIGEAKLEAPSGEGICEPDVKLLPAYWGQGYGLEIITALINQSFRRFPLCGIVQFTPNFNNRVAIRLYAKVGCRVVGQGFTPPQPRRGFVGVRYLIMQIDRHAWEGGERRDYD